MNEKFTPANWQIDEYGDIVQAETDRIICYFIPSRNDVDTANKRLVINAPNLYHKLFEAVSYLENGFTSNTERRLFVSGIKELLCEINPDYDKKPEVTDIKRFAERVKNMRDWQKEHSQNPNSDTERYSESNEDLVDRIVVDILQEAKS